MATTDQAEPANSPTCLIVEDSRFDQLMLQRIVQRTQRDIDIRVAATLDDARRVLEDEAVAIILLDNNLPDGKGANFVLEMARREDWARIPVIIVSDWPSPFMWQKAQLAGVRLVVNKSEMSPDKLLAHLPSGATMH